MQNKPNFQKAKMKLNFYSAKDYENKPRLQKPKNKPNQTQPVVSLPALSKVEVSNLFKRHTCLFRGLQTEDKFRGNDDYE